MKVTVSLVGIILVVLLVLCGCCLMVVSLGGFSLFTVVDQVDTSGPIATLNPFVPTPTVIVELPPVQVGDSDTVSLLRNINVPENDIYDLACRLQGNCNIPLTMQPPAAPRTVGETKAFWITNINTHELFQVTATLCYVSDHQYLWIEDGIRYDADELQALGDAFENRIYPTTRGFFGSEWTPGVDGDPHVYILYARGLGFSLGGYYSSADEANPRVREYSNAHELFLVNADNVTLDRESIFGLLAHEFQHMIHWNVDRNETSWLNEGFSELAAFLNSSYYGGFDWIYTNDPDMQLNDWPNDRLATLPHYGAGFLFTTYFLDRFGEAATQMLAANPQNDLDSMDGVLASLGLTDPLTGMPLTADDVFVDWSIANYLQDPDVADGRYAYSNYPDAPRAGATESLSACPTSGILRSVHQYGLDYIQVTCPGDHTLSFDGATVTHLLPADAYSGSHAFWSNKGDESDMTLTREFDFTSISGPISVTYQAWFDLEEDYDYVYLEVSTDGQRWHILSTPSGTPEDPSGASFGWAYNGGSSGWIREEVDLSQYAGQRVWLRFEYVTDAAINGEGFLLDDVAIQVVDYFSDFESDAGGWEAAGFARVTNILPQTFRLALLTRTRQGFTVEMVPLNPDQEAEIRFHIGEDVQEVVLVVTGTTRFTRELAKYELEIK